MCLVCPHQLLASSSFLSYTQTAQIYQVAFLLEPNLRYLGGFPVRPEVLYAYVGVSMVIAAIFGQLMTWEEFFNSLQIRPDVQTLSDDNY